jgi:GNAT superfamily N-acetyltransferase
MSWVFFSDVEEFAVAAEPVIGPDPMTHTITHTVIENARIAQVPGEWYAVWREPSGAVTGVVSQTPPFLLLLAAVPDDAFEPLVTELPAHRSTGAAQVNGVNAPTALATQFAGIWARRTGMRAVLGHAERLYRLDRLAPPQPDGGAARVAVPADAALLTAWWNAFLAEAGLPRGSDPGRLVESRIERGALVVWEREGAPVAMAGRNPPGAGVVRVGPVYTPPEHRQRGFGGAVTAAVAAAAVAAGYQVVLFTDLANPTSNALYQRLGFRPVSDRAVFWFE